MRFRKSWPVIAVAVTAVSIASVFFLHLLGQIDHSNYTISDSITERVIERFDNLGNKNQEKFFFGGGTRGKAVGQLGISNVMYFGISKPDREVIGILGVHLLHGRENDVIRFSLGQQSPFETTELSASLSENTELRRSFEAMMDRLERTDKGNHKLIADLTAPRKR